MISSPPTLQNFCDNDVKNAYTRLLKRIQKTRWTLVCTYIPWCCISIALLQCPPLPVNQTSWKSCGVDSSSTSQCSDWMANNSVQSWHWQPRVSKDPTEEGLRPTRQPPTLNAKCERGGQAVWPTLNLGFPWFPFKFEILLEWLIELRETVHVTIIHLLWRMHVANSHRVEKEDQVWGGRMPEDRWVLQDFATFRTQRCAPRPRSSPNLCVPENFYVSYSCITQ